MLPLLVAQGSRRAALLLPPLLLLLPLLRCLGPPAKPALGPLLRRRFAMRVEAPGTKLLSASRRMRVPSTDMMTSR
jgi:hypothetical protein